MINFHIIKLIAVQLLSVVNHLKLQDNGSTDPSIKSFPIIHDFHQSIANASQILANNLTVETRTNSTSDRQPNADENHLIRKINSNRNDWSLRLTAENRRTAFEPIRKVSHYYGKREPNRKAIAFERPFGHRYESSLFPSAHFGRPFAPKVELLVQPNNAMSTISPTVELISSYYGTTASPITTLSHTYGQNGGEKLDAKSLPIEFNFRNRNNDAEAVLTNGALLLPTVDNFPISFGRVRNDALESTPIHDHFDGHHTTINELIEHIRDDGHSTRDYPFDFESKRIGGHSKSGPLFDYRAKERPRCASHTDQTFCDEDSDYPVEAIQRALERAVNIGKQVMPLSAEDDNLVDGVQRGDDERYNFRPYFGDNFDSGVNLNDTHNKQGKEYLKSEHYKNGGYICPSRVSYVRLRRARNTNGLWKVVINLREKLMGVEYRQSVRIEECLSNQMECSFTPNIHKSQCVQKHSNHRLLVWSGERGIHLDVFRLPIACSCYFRTNF